MKKNIVHFSGGKDSSAMLLRMVELKMPIDAIIFCDTGKEFPEMYEHIKKVESFIFSKIGLNITKIHSEHTFEYYLGEHIKTKGKHVGCKGYGFPDMKNRWCTTKLKTAVTKNYIKKYFPLDDVVEFIGIAVDEQHRCTRKEYKNRNVKFPLIEWNWSEQDALKYCITNGFDWSGLYKKFSRVSCWCCPLKRISEFRTLWSEYPSLWNKLELMQTKSWRKLTSSHSVDDLSNRFIREKVLSATERPRVTRTPSHS